MTAKRTVKNPTNRSQVEHLKATIERMKAERGTIETKDELIDELRANCDRWRKLCETSDEKADETITDLRSIMADLDRQVRLLEHEVQFLRGLVCAITGSCAPISPQLSPPKVIEEWLEKCRHAGPKGEGWPPHHPERDYVTPGSMCAACHLSDGQHADWCPHR